MRRLTLMPAARFVILHHRLRQGEHWDLMLEDGDRLATWQLPKDPVSPDSFPMVGLRIADHRLHYLTYEGPLSGDRGEVRRVDEGAFLPRVKNDREWRFELEGRRWSGRLCLIHQADERWSLELDPKGPFALNLPGEKTTTSDEQ